MMKQTRYISAVLVLLSALAVASCKNFDYEELVAAGNPVVKAATVGSAEMGDSIDVKVTCNDTEGCAPRHRANMHSGCMFLSCASSPTERRRFA